MRSLKEVEGREMSRSLNPNESQSKPLKPLFSNLKGHKEEFTNKIHTEQSAKIYIQIINSIFNKIFIYLVLKRNKHVNMTKKNMNSKILNLDLSNYDSIYKKKNSVS